jgi:hypothetical protein
MEISFLGTNQLNYIYVESTVNATVTNQTVQDLGNASQPQRFIVEGGKSQNGTRIHNYRVPLNVGDAIGFEFNSTQQVGFSIYYVAEGQPPYTWYSENTTRMRSGLIALRSGTYDFAFTINSPDANVTFNTWKVSWDPTGVLFKESGGSSSAFGGMGWGISYLEPLPRSFVVGSARQRPPTSQDPKNLPEGGRRIPHTGPHEPPRSGAHAKSMLLRGPDT